MPPTALVLVLAAAFAHAGWNLLAKQASGGALFVWLFALCGAAVLAPVAAVQLAVAGGVGAGALGFMAGSGALHAAYFVALQRAYRDGDLSFVYPLARGTGPLLATAAAIVLLGEHPSALALAGGAAIVAAILGLAAAPGARHGQGAAPAFALLTGVCIAVYTLWDKRAVDHEQIAPAVYLCGTLLFQSAILAPWALLDRVALGATWRRERRSAAAGGALAVAAYVMVLYALRIAPVSYVAPAREASILVGAALGAGVLAEADARRRLAAAGGIVAGIAALALG